MDTKKIAKAAFPELSEGEITVEDADPTFVRLPASVGPFAGRYTRVDDTEFYLSLQNDLGDKLRVKILEV